MTLAKNKMINQLKTLILLGVLTGILLFAGQFFGGSQGLFIALLFSVLMNFGAYFFSDKIVLKMYGAKEAKKTDYKELHEMVENTSKKAGLPKPKIFIIPTNTPNAFATGRNPKNAVVAFTEGIIKLLNKEELEGVIAHELAHVKNRDILITTVAATIAGVISYLAQMSQWFFFTGHNNERENGNMVSLLLFAVLTPILAMIIQFAISRSREFLADETGARTIKNSKGLASALKKLESGVQMFPMRHANHATSSLFIVNPFSAKGLISLLSTHPSTEERVNKLNSLKL
jgi:heat shock protein HtpX